MAEKGGVPAWLTRVVVESALGVRRMITWVMPSTPRLVGIGEFPEWDAGHDGADRGRSGGD